MTEQTQSSPVLHGSTQKGGVRVFAVVRCAPGRSIRTQVRARHPTEWLLPAVQCERIACEYKAVSSLSAVAITCCHGVVCVVQVRASIKSLFPERDCAALVRPMLDEAKLAKMDALPYEQLRPEFRKVRVRHTGPLRVTAVHGVPAAHWMLIYRFYFAHKALSADQTPVIRYCGCWVDALHATAANPQQGLESLVETLLSRARPKSLRGQLLTGPALAALAEGYVRVINDGQVPAIASTWQVRLFCQANDQSRNAGACVVCLIHSQAQAKCAMDMRSALVCALHLNGRISPVRVPQSVVQSECRRALDAAGELYKSKMEPARSPKVRHGGPRARLYPAVLPYCSGSRRVPLHGWHGRGNSLVCANFLPANGLAPSAN